MNHNLYIDLLEKEVLSLRDKISRNLTMSKIPVNMNNIHTRAGAQTAANIMDVTNDALTKMDKENGESR